MTQAGLRRLLHAGSAAVLLPVWLGWGSVLRYLLAALLVVAGAVDVTRLEVPFVRKRLTALVPVFRASEMHTLSGATWLCIGYFLASWFPAPASVGGILAGALADPAASCAGSRGTGMARKTWRGSAAAGIATAAALTPLGVAWGAVVGGAAAAALLERWPGPFDDNLVVPPGVALTLWLLA